MAGHWRDRFKPSGFFLLRTPTLPFEVSKELGAGLEAPTASVDTERLADALARDRETLRQRLARLIEQADIREALFLASPSLFERIDLDANTDADRREKVELALARYLTRMASRPTPFGLFAGCTLGEIGDETRFELADRASATRHSRLDMDYLSALAEALQRDSDLRGKLIFRPNSSLYRLHDRIHYVEWKLNVDGRAYELVAVDASDYLHATLERARSGALPSDLAEALVRDDPEISLEEAAEFIDSLIDNQILVSELEPRITGPEPLDGMIDQLASRAAPVAAALREARELLSRCDRESHEHAAAVDRYHAIVAKLSDLPAKPELARLVQVDLYKPAQHVTLGGAVLDELARGVEALHGMVRGEQDRLVRFRETFRNRYEDREVPLVEALDEEKGVGFEVGASISADVSPLLDGLTFPSAETKQRVAWGKAEIHMLRRLSEALRGGEKQITLDARDIEALSTRDPLPLPDAFAIMARVAAPSADALRNGDFRVCLDLASGPSGAMLIGRFCHGDEWLSQLVRDHLRDEEAARPDAIYAEIVHLPEGRMGNVLLRPVLRDYEIPYQGASGVENDRQIPITDLFISVVNDRIVLRSRRLGREIIPRLTSAHNFNRRTLGIYRFLGALQGQGIAAGMMWNWGALDAAPFLPRVIYGKVVLARARWLIGTAESQRLTALRGVDRFRELQRWRVERDIPKLVVIADNDNELLIDFDNALSCEVFLKQLAARDATLLTEPFPMPDELLATAPDGHYTNEVIIPCVRARQPEQAAHAISTTDGARREFPPGSDWLYLKLYTGIATCDRLLSRFVRPLVDDALRGGVASRWFFVRYGDPDWHLRVRLYGEGRALSEWLAARLNETATELIADGLAYRVQLDTYQREIERYGGAAGVEIAEQFFHADSDAAVAILESLEGAEGAEARWRLALRTVDYVLIDMGFDFAARRDIARRLATGFSQEFRVEAALRRQMSDRYRKQRELIEEALVAEWTDEHPLAPGFDILQQRSNATRDPFAELRRLSQAGKLTTTLEDLASSFVHMSVNRLLRSSHRAQECVLYYLLDRVYESRAARNKGAQ